MDITKGRVYRAKKPAPVGGGFFEPQFFNDRVVLFVGEDTVQYDSPAIPIGGRFKTISKEKFLKWAGEDVTDLLPPNKWARWE